MKLWIFDKNLTIFLSNGPGSKLSKKVSKKIMFQVAESERKSAEKSTNKKNNLDSHIDIAVDEAIFDSALKLLQDGQYLIPPAYQADRGWQITLL